MKLTLRDFFWLLLVVGSATAWVMEHRRATAAARRLRFGFVISMKERRARPTEAELARRSSLESLSKLTDEELDEKLGSLPIRDRYGWTSEYEQCLVEMARRGLVDDLQRRYDALMS